MPVYIASLNSGSNGNCYYVGNDTEAILVDIGITCLELETRMGRLGLDMNKVQAIFISHEHTDHIAGVTVVAKKYKLPVYITGSTLRHSGLKLDGRFVVSFNAVHPICIGGLSIKAFPKHHDASDPHSFVVSSASNVHIGVFTDIGQPCKELIGHFKICHAAFLESNYDEAMLMAGRYPYFLKNRIRGGAGHLSNDQAFQLFTEHKPPFMSHLLLAHLSKENNSPELVQNLFRSFPSQTQITIASRYKESPLIELSDKQISVPVRRINPRECQLSLF